MGEYLTIRGQYRKVGTCESFYYIRYSELKEAVLAGQVEEEARARQYLESGHFRFRFPFPDEDETDLSVVDDFDRGYMTYAPKRFLDGIEHYRLTNSVTPQGIRYGYNVNVFTPCIQDPAFDGSSSPLPPSLLVQIVQQKPVDGQLWTVLRCAYCGAAFRIDEAEAIRLAEYITEQGGNPEIVKRMLAGYEQD